YRSFANVFTQVAIGASPEAKKLVDSENAQRRKQNEENRKNKKPQVSEVRELFIGTNGLPGKPNAKKPLPAKLLGGPALKVEPDLDVRRILFDWLRSPPNGYFARSFVNRVWAHYLGVGLVDPVDNFSAANPPSNEALLDALAKDFVDHGYDLR